MGPKQIEKYIPLINQQASDLVSRLLESSEKNNNIDPYYYFSMYSLNVISDVCMGKKFESVEDPDFIKLVDSLTDSMKFAGLENDLPNFLPVLSFVDHLTGIKGKMKDFVENKRDPAMKKFIQEASTSDRPNMIRSFIENGHAIPEDELIVLLCKL